MAEVQKIAEGFLLDLARPLGESNSGGTEGPALGGSKDRYAPQSLLMVMW